MYRLLLLIIFLIIPSWGQADVLTEDTLWQGNVALRDDVLIPEGVTLTVAPGTEVRAFQAENTKIDPEFLSHQTEIIVRGSLKILGEAKKPVVFLLNDTGNDERWAGIIVDGGNVSGQWCQITGAENGLLAVSGSVDLLHATVEQNHYGIIVQSAKARVALRNSKVIKNDYGLLIFDNGTVSEEKTEVFGNEKADRFVRASKLVKVLPKVYELAPGDLTKTYKNETLLGTNIWQGRVRIDGQVRLSPDAQLVIMPGTVVEFSKRDTNGDGIGENGILIQGVFWAKGTPEAPIIFRSAEAEPQMGDWDSINILGSDQSRNLIEFCQIEDAYRGMHFHFSNVAVTNSVMRHNYRGMQFQESLVEIRDNQFYRNKSAIQARDSEVIFTGNRLFANLNGANLFRLNLTATHNIFSNNRWEGLRIREGAATVVGNEMLANRFGLLVADAVFGRFNGNVLAANIEAGLALKNTDNIETQWNAIIGNGINGIIVRESRGVIANNFIADNGERGIGIQSFSGRVTANNIVNNGMYGIGLEGQDNIDATGNWWGESDLAQEIFDKNDDSTLGLVSYEPGQKNPYPYQWPVANVSVDLSWRESIVVQERVTVKPGATLAVEAGTQVQFGQAIGMDVFGTIEARGEENKRILFTSLARKGPEDWDEVSLDRAMDSYFINCDFEYATWGVHSHYSNIIVSQSRFQNNDGGMRFRSGPVTIKDSLFQHNRIGSRAFLAFGEIIGNIYTQNEIGIFVREKGGGMTVNQNNIFDNERYNIAFGDFNDEDVNAKHNWWNGVSVVDTVFDGNRESYIGKVLYAPVLKKPIVLDWLEKLQ